MFVQRVPWTQQPPPGTPIAWQNPICRDLRFLVVSNNYGRDSAEGIQPTSADVVVSTNRGLALQPTEGIAWQYGDADYAKAANAPGVTVLAYARSNVAAPPGMSQINPGPGWGPSAPNHVRFFWVPTGGSAHHTDFTIRTTAASQTDRLASGLDPSSGGQDPEKWNVLGGTYDGATMHTRINYVKSAGSALTGAINAGSATLNVGAGATGDNVWLGEVAFSAIWARGLSDQEWNALADNVWQLFEPRAVVMPEASVVPPIVPSAITGGVVTGAGVTGAGVTASNVVGPPA